MQINLIKRKGKKKKYIQFTTFWNHIQHNKIFRKINEFKVASVVNIKNGILWTDSFVTIYN